MSDNRVWRVRVDAVYGPVDVVIPEAAIIAEVQRAMARHLGPGVGFINFKKAWRSVKRTARGALKSPGAFLTAPLKIATAPLGQLAPKIARDAAQSITRKAEKTANKAVKVGRDIARSDEFAAALTAASFAVPALAPASGALLAARSLDKQIASGTKAARQLASGAQSAFRGAQQLTGNRSGGGSGNLWKRMRAVQRQQLMRKVKDGADARSAAIRAVAAAKQGDPRAMALMGALRMFR